MTGKQLAIILCCSYILAQYTYAATVTERKVEVTKIEESSSEGKSVSKRSPDERIIEKETEKTTTHSESHQVSKRDIIREKKTEVIKTHEETHKVLRKRDTETQRRKGKGKKNRPSTTTTKKPNESTTTEKSAQSEATTATEKPAPDPSRSTDNHKSSLPHQSEPEGYSPNCAVTKCEPRLAKYAEFTILNRIEKDLVDWQMFISANRITYNPEEATMLISTVKQIDAVLGAISGQAQGGGGGDAEERGQRGNRAGAPLSMAMGSFEQVFASIKPMIEQTIASTAAQVQGQVQAEIQGQIQRSIQQVMSQFMPHK